MSAPPSPSPAGNQDDAPQQSEHLNIKVTDNNNEVFFKIKRTTQLKKLMDAFCERQGKSFTSVRFLFDGTRVNPTDNPEMVSETESRAKDSVKHKRSQRANTATARDAGRRHPRGPPGADWRRLLNAPKLPACLTHQHCTTVTRTTTRANQKQHRSVLHEMRELEEYT